MTRYDAVVIGSGISSLTCALLLAKRGKRVVVLEQHYKPGGYMHCFNRFGERFDTGAHYVGGLGERQPFRVLLEYLGVFDERLFVPLDPKGFDVLRFPRFVVELPQGYDQVISALGDQFPSERRAVRRYFELVREAASRLPTYEFNDSHDMIAAAAVLEVSLKQTVEDLTANRALQCVFYSYCALHAVEPQDTPFGFHAIVTDSLIRGPYGLAHGGDALARQFVNALSAAGCRVMTRKKVVSLEMRDRAVSAVRTQDGDRFEADWVISGIHPKATFRMLADQSALTPAFRERVAGLRESTGFFGVYAACSRSTFDPLRNHYFFDTENPDELCAKRAWGDLPAAAFVTSSRRVRAAETEAARAVEAYPYNLHAVAPMEWFESWHDSAYGKRPDEYESFKSAYAQDILRLVDRYEPGFSATVSRFATSSPLTNLHFNGSECGSAYGLYHSIQNTGARALGPRTKVLNLLLTGQNCVFPGLLGASVAALRTAGHVVGIKSILSELKARLTGAWPVAQN